jgi:hypothetical protein
VKDALVAAVVAMAGVCGREWHTWSARRCGCLLATTKNLNSFGRFDCKANQCLLLLRNTIVYLWFQL